MSFFKDFFRRPAETKQVDRFTLASLRSEWARLKQHTTIVPSTRDEVIELIRSICEVIIWGERFNPVLFDFFAENCILKHFVGLLLRNNEPQLQCQIIQSISMLIQNTNSEISVFYLLSNNHINDLIVFPFSFDHEDLLATYVSFLKSLSLKLNVRTIQFFYNDRSKDFPLYTESLKFFSHHDPMIRISVRTITLNVFSCVDKAMRLFVISHSAITQFSSLMIILRRETFLLQNKIQQLSMNVGSNSSGVSLTTQTQTQSHSQPQSQSNPNPQQQLQNRNTIKSPFPCTQSMEEPVELFLDQILYFQDVLDLKLPGLSHALTDQYLCHHIIPLLLNALLPKMLVMKKVTHKIVTKNNKQRQLEYKKNKKHSIDNEKIVEIQSSDTSIQPQSQPQLHHSDSIEKSIIGTYGHVISVPFSPPSQSPEAEQQSQQSQSNQKERKYDFGIKVDTTNVSTIPQTLVHISTKKNTKNGSKDNNKTPNKPATTSKSHTNDDVIEYDVISREKALQSVIQSAASTTTDSERDGTPHNNIIDSTSYGITEVTDIATLSLMYQEPPPEIKYHELSNSQQEQQERLYLQHQQYVQKYNLEHRSQHGYLSTRNSSSASASTPMSSQSLSQATSTSTTSSVDNATNTIANPLRPEMGLYILLLSILNLRDPIILNSIANLLLSREIPSIFAFLTEVPANIPIQSIFPLLWLTYPKAAPSGFRLYDKNRKIQQGKNMMRARALISVKQKFENKMFQLVSHKTEVYEAEHEKSEIEKERLERERIERERVERERLEREERERLERERVERERIEREQREERERLERERIERERIEKERIEKEKIEKERIEKERIEQERLAKIAKEKAELDALDSNNHNHRIENQNGDDDGHLSNINEIPKIGDLADVETMIGATNTNVQVEVKAETDAKIESETQTEAETETESVIENNNKIKNDITPDFIESIESEPTETKSETDVVDTVDTVDADAMNTNNTVTEQTPAIEIIESTTETTLTPVTAADITEDISTISAQIEDSTKILAPHDGENMDDVNKFTESSNINVELNASMESVTDESGIDAKAHETASTTTTTTPPTSRDVLTDEELVMLKRSVPSLDYNSFSLIPSDSVTTFYDPFCTGIPFTQDDSIAILTGVNMNDENGELGGHIDHNIQPEKVIDGDGTISSTTSASSASSTSKSTTTTRPYTVFSLLDEIENTISVQTPLNSLNTSFTPIKEVRGENTDTDADIDAGTTSLHEQEQELELEQEEEEKIEGESKDSKTQDQYQHQHQHQQHYSDELVQSISKPSLFFGVLITNDKEITEEKGHVNEDEKEHEKDAKENKSGVDIKAVDSTPAPVSTSLPDPVSAKTQSKKKKGKNSKSTKAGIETEVKNDRKIENKTEGIPESSTASASVPTPVPTPVPTTIKKQAKTGIELLSTLSRKSITNPYAEQFYSLFKSRDERFISLSSSILLSLMSHRSIGRNVLIDKQIATVPELYQKSVLFRSDVSESASGDIDTTVDVGSVSLPSEHDYYYNNGLVDDLLSVLQRPVLRMNTIHTVVLLLLELVHYNTNAITIDNNQTTQSVQSAQDIESSQSQSTTVSATSTASTSMMNPPANVIFLDPKLCTSVSSAYNYLTPTHLATLRRILARVTREIVPLLEDKDLTDIVLNSIHECSIRSRTLLPLAGTYNPFYHTERIAEIRVEMKKHAEKVEQERVEKIRKEKAEKLEQERLEKIRIERERRERVEKAKAERERMERMEKERRAQAWHLQQTQAQQQGLLRSGSSNNGGNSNSSNQVNYIKNGFTGASSNVSNVSNGSVPGTPIRAPTHGTSANNVPNTMVMDGSTSSIASAPVYTTDTTDITSTPTQNTHAGINSTTTSTAALTSSPASIVDTFSTASTDLFASVSNSLSSFTTMASNTIQSNIASIASKEREKEREREKSGESNMTMALTPSGGVIVVKTPHTPHKEKKLAPTLPIKKDIKSINVDVDVDVDDNSNGHEVGQGFIQSGNVSPSVVVNTKDFLASPTASEQAWEEREASQETRETNEEINRESEIKDDIIDSTTTSITTSIDLGDNADVDAASYPSASVSALPHPHPIHPVLANNLDNSEFYQHQQVQEFVSREVDNLLLHGINSQKLTGLTPSQPKSLLSTTSTTSNKVINGMKNVPFSSIPLSPSSPTVGVQRFAVPDIDIAGGIDVSVDDVVDDIGVATEVNTHIGLDSDTDLDDNTTTPQVENVDENENENGGKPMIYNDKNTTASTSTPSTHNATHKHMHDLDAEIDYLYNNMLQYRHKKLPMSPITFQSIINNIHNVIHPDILFGKNYTNIKITKFIKSAAKGAELKTKTIAKRTKKNTKNVQGRYLIPHIKRVLLSQQGSQVAGCTRSTSPSFSSNGPDVDINRNGYIDEDTDTNIDIDISTIDEKVPFDFRYPVNITESILTSIDTMLVIRQLFNILANVTPYQYPSIPELSKQQQLISTPTTANAITTTTPEITSSTTTVPAPTNLRERALAQNPFHKPPPHFIPYIPYLDLQPPPERGSIIPLPASPILPSTLISALPFAHTHIQAHRQGKRPSGKLRVFVTTDNSCQYLLVLVPVTPGENVNSSGSSSTNSSTNTGVPPINSPVRVIFAEKLIYTKPIQELSDPSVMSILLRSSYEPHESATMAPPITMPLGDCGSVLHRVVNAPAIPTINAKAMDHVDVNEQFFTTDDDTASTSVNTSATNVSNGDGTITVPSANLYNDDHESDYESDYESDLDEENIVAIIRKFGKRPQILNPQSSLCSNEATHRIQGPFPNNLPLSNPLWKISLLTASAQSAAACVLDLTKKRTLLRNSTIDSIIQTADLDDEHSLAIEKHFTM